MKYNGGAPDFSPTIVIAEQGNGFNRFPQYLLQSAGYHAVKAAHGYEALYLARLHAVSLGVLIAEVDLPFIGGWELAARLESIKPDVKTILITPENVHHVGGNLACLPAARCSPETLLRTVRALLAPPAGRVLPLAKADRAFDRVRAAAVAHG